MNYYGAKTPPKAGARFARTPCKSPKTFRKTVRFKAAPDTMSVAEMLAHLATSTHWATQIHFVDKMNAVTIPDFGKLLGEAGKQAGTLTSKAAIVGALKSHGEDFAKKLATLSDAQLAETVTLPNGSKTRFEMLLGPKEHEMHHRAQLFQIERMVGIVPHLTRARQQAQAQAAAPAR